MPIYVVVPTKGLRETIEQIKKDETKSLDALIEPFAEGGYLVNFAGTGAELGKMLGIHEDRPLAQGLIMPLAGHYGYANNQIWQWIKSRQEKTDGQG